MKKKFLFFVLLSAMLPAYTFAQSRPNILVIVPDDVGWSDVGYNGSSIKTPNLDQLALSGIKLDYQYVAPTCTPTRVGLFTGRYPSRFGVTSPDYGELMPIGTPTLASLLGNKGYFTAIDGKWHMGSPPYTPLKYGFRSSYGYYDGQIDPYTHTYKTENKKGNIMTSKSWNRNDEYIEEEGHVTDLITNEAIRIIKEKREHPFYLYVAYSVPHYPLDEPHEWTSIYENIFAYSSRRNFAASMTHMDAGIGQIIDALNETGQRDNTLILFMSDNGGQDSWPIKERKTQYEGRYENIPHDVLGNNFPFQGWKGSVYEGAVRVPAFVNWPGHLIPGTLDVPVNFTDWLPTFLALTGNDQESLQRLNLDGENIWPLLKREKKESDFKNRAMYWKTPGVYAVSKGSWKLLVNQKTGNVELYDLQSDFREQHNVSRENDQKVQQLKQVLENFKNGDK